jgi:syntaxin-binding protein 5
MTHLLRAKQSGIQADFSETINSTLFAPTFLNHYGINSQITKISYDPVQSLLAVGTASTRFGNGRIYVFGSGRIEVQFDLPRKNAGVKWMSFCADRLVVLDDKGDLLIFGLVERKLQSSYSPPGSVISVACDPTLDFVVLGLQNGELQRS